MRIVCLVSHNPGHLDFGGRGFIRLAEHLRERGHRVTWIAGDATTKILTRRGHDIEAELATETFAGSAIKSYTNTTAWAASCENIRRCWSALQVARPDVLLVDRCLAVTAPIAESLGVPFATIGSPGGVWVRTAAGMQPSDEAAVADYLNVAQRLAAEIDWFEAPVTSEWLTSPKLNVSFLGRSFYPEEPLDATATFIDLFSSDRVQPCQRRGRIGFSFGHTGRIERLRSVLDRVLEDRALAPGGIDVFLGGRPDAVPEFLPYQELGATIHGWRDFQRAFRSLSALVTFGGIGTIWHTIESEVPSLVVPGDAGDQCFNGAAIERLGMGHLCDGNTVSLLSRMRDSPSEYATAFAEFKNAGNFSGGLSSICDRVEELSS